MTVAEKRRLLKEIEIVDKTDKNGFSYKSFNAPHVMKPTEEHVGQRVWVASEKRTAKIELVSVEEDSYVIQRVGEVVRHHLYKSEVLIHPNNW